MVSLLALGPDVLAASDTVWRFLGRLHPMVVHFPIALILVALGAELATSLRGRRRSRTAVACLVIGAVGAALAAWLGWLNADFEPERRGVDDILFAHRWVGIATVAAAAAGALSAAIDALGRWSWSLIGYRAALALSALLVCIGGHLGGSLVFGSDYLFAVLRTGAPPAAADAPAAEAAAPPAAVSLEPVAFDADIRPIFEGHCVHCHGSGRQRAGVRLDSLAAIFGRARDDWVIEPGDAGASALLERITLPQGDADLMPADADPLPSEQIALIRAWIEQLGDDPLAAAEAAVAAEAAAPGTPQPAPGTAPAEPAVDPAARDRALRAVMERGGLATPVESDTSEVDVDLSLCTDLTDGDLALLQGLEPSLVWLNLARTGVSDEGLAALAPFRKLRRLRLDNTALGDDGLRHIGQLTDLEALNLYGTKVTDAGLVHLAPLRKLRRLYVWRTGISESGIRALSFALPGVTVIGDEGAAATP